MRLLHPSTSCAAGLAAVVLIPVILSGCSRQPSLVGKWSGSGPASAARLAAVVAYSYDFHDDGLVEMSAKSDRPDAFSSSPMASAFFGNVSNLHAAGSYTLKGDVLTLSLTTMTLLDDKGQPPPITPTVNKDPRTLRCKISVGTLTLDLMDGNKPLVLTRQKDAE